MIERHLALGLLFADDAGDDRIFMMTRHAWLVRVVRKI